MEFEKIKKYYEKALELFKEEKARKYIQESLIYYDAHQPSMELLKKIDTEVEKIKEIERKKETRRANKRIV